MTIEEHIARTLATKAKPDIDDLLARIQRRTKTVQDDGVITTNQPIKGTRNKDVDNRVQQDDSTPSTADIALVVALDDPEERMLMNAFSSSWTLEGREGVTYRVATCRLGDVDATVVLTSQNEMGMVPAAILAAKTIYAWRPAFIGMSGICAGVKDQGINLGDIVVAQKVFDYGAGKVLDGKFLADWSPVNMDSGLLGRVRALAGDREVLHSIRSDWPVASGRPDTELKAHVGAFGSGASVVADDRIIQDVRQHMRSVKAIDMEAYAIARSAAEAAGGPIPFLIAKGIQDFADSSKSDKFRDYSAFVSAVFMYRFLEVNAKEIIRRKNPRSGGTE